MPSTDDAKHGWVRRVLEIDPAPAMTGGSSKGSAVRLAQARLAWNNARAVASERMLQLERAMLQAVEGLDIAEEVRANTWRLHATFDTLDTRLSDTLDAALNATDPIDRMRFQAAAHGIAAEYLAFVKTDPLLREIDDNPFVAVSVAAPLTATLTNLRQELG